MGNSTSAVASEFSNAIERLKTERVSRNDKEFWTKLFSLPLSTPEEIFALLTPGDCRQVRDTMPGNYRALMEAICSELTRTCRTKDGSVERRTLLPCLRVLTRATPFLLERPDVAKELLWSVEPGERPLGERLADAVLTCLFLDGFTVKFPGQVVADLNPATRASNPAYSVQPGLVWEGGCYPAAPPAASSATPVLLLANRAEALRALVALLSQPLFVSVTETRMCPAVSFVEYLASGRAPHAHTLFLSLLNSACNYGADWWGVPFASVLTSDPAEAVLDGSLQVLAILLDYTTPEERAILMGTAPAPGPHPSPNQGPSQGPHSPSSSSSSPSRAAAAAPSSSTSRQDLLLQQPSGSLGASGSVAAAAAAAPPVNLFRQLLATSIRADNFGYVASGLARLLDMCMRASAAYILGATKDLHCQQEVLLLLWRLLECNRGFYIYLCAGSAAQLQSLLTPILYFMAEAKGDLGKVGLVHVCVFTLLHLSGERAFCVALNNPASTKALYGVDIPAVTGNLGDLTFLTLHRLMFTEGQGLALEMAGLFDCALTILCNASPYLKTLAPVTTRKLSQLAQAIGDKKYLYANESNHRHLFLIVETFNNMLQYQFAGHAALVAAIISSGKMYEQLGKPVRPKSDRGKEPSTSSGTRDPDGGRGGGDDGSRGGGGQRAPGQPFSPTAEWVNSWRPKLPLQAIRALIAYMTPLVETFCRDNATVEEASIIRFVQAQTLVGILPVPHPILIRKYTPNDNTQLWFTTYLFGLIYIRSLGTPLFDSRTIRLFSISQGPHNAAGSSGGSSGGGGGGDGNGGGGERSGGAPSALQQADKLAQERRSAQGGRSTMAPDHVVEGSTDSDRAHHLTKEKERPRSRGSTRESWDRDREREPERLEKDSNRDRAREREHTSAPTASRSGSSGLAPQTSASVSSLPAASDIAREGKREKREKGEKSEKSEKSEKREKREKGEKREKSEKSERRREERRAGLSSRDVPDVAAPGFL